MGINGLPFLRVNQSSLLTPTTSLSPNARAALKYSICPECSGSNPPVTNTTFIRYLYATIMIV